MEIIKRVICLATFITLCPANINASGGHEKKTVLDSIKVNDIWRTFEYHIPQFPTPNPRLIVVLHGDGMTSKSIQTATGFEFNKLADKTASTIVVYPQGYRNYWNSCRKEASFETKIKGMSDVIFIESIIKRMEVRYRIDHKNVFAVGYLNGGNMCYKLAKTIPNIFKGFAAIGANLPVNTNDDSVSVGKPVSIMAINYISDTINPYEGDEVASADTFKKEKVLFDKETMDHWLNLLERNDKIPLSSLSSTKVKANYTFFREDYFSNEKNKRVSHIKIVKDGYPFLNSKIDQWLQLVANMNKYIDIPETVVHFFYRLQCGNPGH